MNKETKCHTVPYYICERLNILKYYLTKNIKNKLEFLVIVSKADL